MPVDLRYASALFATWRGSRLYGSPVNGSTISMLMFSVERVTERVDVGRRRVRDQLHVGLVDRLEAADRRTVEHLAVGEEVLVQRGRGHVEVLHDTGQVAEPDIDELDVVVLEVLRYLVGVREQTRLHFLGDRHVGARGAPVVAPR